MSEAIYRGEDLYFKTSVDTWMMLYELAVEYEDGDRGSDLYQELDEFLFDDLCNNHPAIAGEIISRCLDSPHRKLRINGALYAQRIYDEERRTFVVGAIMRGLEDEDDAVALHVAEFYGKEMIIDGSDIPFTLDDLKNIISSAKSKLTELSQNCEGRV